MVEWRETTLVRIIADNPSKSRTKCLQLLFDKLQKVQKGLFDQSENTLKDQVIAACQGVPECSLALFQPASTYEGVCAQLRSAIGTAMRSRGAQHMQHFAANEVGFSTQNGLQQFPATEEGEEAYWTDRTYRGRGSY